MENRIRIESLVKAAILSALSVVLTRMLSVYITPNMRVGLGPLPIIMSGIFLGPIFGTLTGIAADLIGVLINAGGTPHLGFTLSSALTGLIPGVICFLIFKNNPKEKINLKILLIVLLVFGIVHLGLNTLWLKDLYHTPFWTLLPERVTKVVVEAIITAILLKIIMENFSKFFQIKI